MTGNTPEHGRPTPALSGVNEVVADALSPSAPGLPPDSAIPVDAALVTPRPWSTGRPLVIAGVVAAGAVLALAVAVRTDSGWILGIDERLHAAAVVNRSSPDVAFAGVITWVGATAVALPLVWIVGAAAPRGPVSWRGRLGSGALLAAVAASGVYAGLRLNGVIDRTRPPIADWAGAAGGPAFPSGHTTMATLLAGTCAWALSARLAPGRPRRLVWAAAAVVAVAVGWSRVWLGVHWPSDVVAGWLFALAWCCIAAAAVSIRSWQHVGTAARRHRPQHAAGGTPRRRRDAHDDR